MTAVAERRATVSALLVRGKTFTNMFCVCTVTRRSRQGNWVDLVVTGPAGNTWRKRQQLTPGFLDGVRW